MIDVATDPMAMRTGHSGRISALASVLVHALLIAGFAVTSIRIASEESRTIPLVIRDPAPPPPPPGAPGPGPPRPVQVASGAKFVDAPKPIEVPKPVEKPKIAAQPTARKAPPKQVSTPATSLPPTPAAVVAAPAALPGGDSGAGATGGVIGGVRGGQVGGQIGGRLGGTGDDVWSADQVAVPPKVLESVRPQYPPLARARGQEGVVIVQAIIDRGGAVESEAVQVVKSQPPFDEAAVMAFRQWKFQPGRDDGGQKVRVLVQQPIRFQLR
jgi:protein TonB